MLKTKGLEGVALVVERATLVAECMVGAREYQAGDPGSIPLWLLICFLFIFLKNT